MDDKSTTPRRTTPTTATRTCHCCQSRPVAPKNHWLCAVCYRLDEDRIENPLQFGRGTASPSASF